jgi:peptide/nickel transport system ATP-binding protein
MLEIRDLTVRFGSGHDVLTAVDQASLHIPAGGTIGLVGESGSGKSTIARAIVGLVPVAGGSIELDGIDFTSRRSRDTPEFRRRVQMVFQDPYSSLNPRMTIGETIREALSVSGGMSRAGRRAESIRLLGMVGLGPGSLARYPHQFSGGQRQRIAIARALAVSPQVIVLDEVSSALDVSVQATILNLLKQLQKELGLSYLFISHDLSVIGVMCDLVAVLYLGRLVERAPTEMLFAEPRHPYTRALIDSIPAFEARRRAPLSGEMPDPRRPPVGCRFHTRCPVGPSTHPERTICIEQDPQQTAELREHRAACHFATPGKAAQIAK